eukprot:CAMPEP_0114997960 /NCGR_PEP_ID=MMETSP0216-20121206/15213_1 /TAXON_ID=223996 /ORGANISM="Protocruzia adherens, Strain Boccale" /LENGTH=58 /DNA_ID=CAMNT_0002362447 /DNA_START=168 /DNA_END=341 /DNA_ORIENTATION=+
MRFWPRMFLINLAIALSYPKAYIMLQNAVRLFIWNLINSLIALIRKPELIMNFYLDAW